MMRNRFALLSAGAAVALIAGVWLTMHRHGQQSAEPGGKVFTDLAPALAEIGEIRLSKGDGSRTTLRKEPSGWTVVERHYPADPARVRELVLHMVELKVIEPKTSDPANYARLGVEAPDKPSAASTLVELVAGDKTWSLLVGRNAEGRSIYVRKPQEAVSALAEPALSVDPDQKRWIDRELTDIPGASVHDIAVQPADGPDYLLSRAQRGDADLELSPVPKGRKPASSMSINGQADTLAGFHFDDLHTPSGTPPKTVDRATYRTFDGQVFEFTGHKDGDKAYVAVTASRDPELAAQFAEPQEANDKPADKPADAKPAAGADTAKPSAAPAKAAAPPADHTVERVAARAKGIEYEIPMYKYDALFKPLEELLEKKPQPAAKSKK
ncbi:MAG TPA: DUF4340 domain-containing protein [Steroidobacteraceae bacterium]|nr:DUF4340 domain-containing protein [Steroidobacteraceae bacterium]